MIDDPRAEVENAVLLLLRSTVAAHSGVMARLGLRSEILEIRRTGDVQRYGSEAGVYFWCGEDLVDALEFPIFTQGRRALTLEETASWLSAAMLDVIERARDRLG